jgi:hypothetical protein
MIEGTRKLVEHELATTPDILSKLYAKKDFRMIGLNVDVIGRALLLRGMIAQRVDHNTAAALADFRLAAGYTAEFDKSLAAIRDLGGAPCVSADLNIASFEIPIFACVLAGDWGRSRAVASLTRDALVRDLEDPVKALMTRLLAALILEDEAGFQRLRERYDRAKKSRWWQHFPVYIDMYEAVLKRDSSRYIELAAQADVAFRARARDKQFGTLRPEYGGQEQNDIVLDFMALGIAAVARSRNIALPPDSDIVPYALI